MEHVVLFSGGIGSWAAAKRVREQRPDDTIVCLFTDTKTEDEDLYRFIEEAADDVRGQLVTIADGRDVWEVFFDERMIGNTRADICSRVLKRDLTRNWIKTNCDPADTIIYIGIDWTEIHRYERAAPRWEPFTLKAPLCDPPYISKAEVMAWAAAEELVIPRLYVLGFPHNNCGGFCVKQGHAAFQHLLKTMPERYAYHEAKEQEFRKASGKDVAILRDRRRIPGEGSRGQTKPFTLRQLRQRVESKGDQLTLGDDWGGCGCMVD